jgi:hypothetical protein
MANDGSDEAAFQEQDSAFATISPEDIHILAE